MISENQMKQLNRSVLSGEDPPEFPQPDMSENFKKWVADNEDKIETANNRGTLPYFLWDNAKFAGISVNKINVIDKTDLLKEAKLKYNAYSLEDWTKAYFDKISGGFNRD
jgi:hypothetical protein